MCFVFDITDAVRKLGAEILDSFPLSFRFPNDLSELANPTTHNQDTAPKAGENFERFSP
jgi:hypothetical protein